jgi:choline dehydrogenase-like flavoprotein
MTLGACQYCGHCEYFGCESNSKASPNICIMPVLRADNRFELRTHAYVKSLNYDRRAKKVTSVTYINRNTGEEMEQPADLVVLCAYPFNIVNLLLTSGIGQPYNPDTGRGVVGKNYCLQTMSNVQIFVEDEINPFIGTGVNPAAVDDFPGRQFRPRWAWLLRRRLSLSEHQRRPSDPSARNTAGHAALGLRMEEGDDRVVQSFVRHQRARHELCLAHELSRSRSDL